MPWISGLGGSTSFSLKFDWMTMLLRAFNVLLCRLDTTDMRYAFFMTVGNGQYELASRTVWL